jgi:outer membrane lipoprotein SlyB
MQRPRYQVVRQTHALQCAARSVHIQEEKVIAVNMSVESISKPRLHPMIVVACAAVVVVCAVGTAAILGWLPSSSAKNSEISSLAETNPPVVVAPPVQTSVQNMTPVAKPVAQHANQRIEAQPAGAIAPRCAECGVVESAREVTTPAQGSGVGAVGGAVVGGVLGHQVGGGRGRDLATVLGAVGGAFAGNHIEGQVKATRSLEVVVRLDDGSTRTLHQAEQTGVRAGDRVKIVNGVARVNG